MLIVNELLQRNARGGRSTTNSTTSDEQALFAGGFKGKCGLCGKFGHKQFLQ